MFRKASKPQSRIDSWIGSSTSIEGNLYFSGGMRVDGVIRGNVTAQPDQPGTLVVSENALGPAAFPSLRRMEDGGRH